MNKMDLLVAYPGLVLALILLCASYKVLRHLLKHRAVPVYKYGYLPIGVSIKEVAKQEHPIQYWTASFFWMWGFGVSLIWSIFMTPMLLIGTLQFVFGPN